MGKVEELEKKYKELEMQFSKKKAKPFRLPMKAKKSLRTVKKKPQHIVTQYLGQDGKMRFRICPIVSGNIIVVNNKAHKINPKAIWRYGKQSWYIHREIDRRPVSNEDYEEVKKSKNDTDSDNVLIKAVLGAIMKPKKEMKKSAIIWIIIIAVLAIVGFVIFGGGGGTPAV